VIKVIKSGIDADVAADMDAKVKSTVETTLKDIETRGDAAVRELSEKFDKWSPKSFRLSDEEIQAAMSRLPAKTIDDIKFAQAQIRCRDSESRVAGRRRRNFPRRLSRPQKYPGQQCRLLHSGW
jgi:sulfopropanediol 3-dehydrogenase